MTKAGVSFLRPVEVRGLTTWLDIVPTKKLEQNFVHDTNTVRQIVVTTDLPEDSYLVEVSPGLGSLTLGLLEHYGRATVVEIDHRLAARLPQAVTGHAEGCALELIEKDALKVSREDFQAALDALVANLPYNVSIPVLLHMPAELPTTRRVLVMVQSEVTDRLAAQPDFKIYGVSSVKAAYYGIMRRAGAIGLYVFWPVPEIGSGLVRIDYYTHSGTPETSDVPGALETAPWEISSQFRAQLFPLIDAAFTQRRKTLRTALPEIYGSDAAAEEALMAAGIDPRRRGEKLEIADFIHFAEVSR